MSKKAPILPTPQLTNLRSITKAHLIIQSREIVELWYLTYGTTNMPNEALSDETPINPESAGFRKRLITSRSDVSGGSGLCG
ncbi:MAG: hypothetical protein HQK96_18590 [Nitrospirae bacterium]|nr:hypothetical protein [Nitrospirota bacterium]